MYQTTINWLQRLKLDFFCCIAACLFFRSPALRFLLYWQFCTLDGPNVLQGVSHWRVQSKSALRCRRINNFIVLWCIAAYRGLSICVSTTSFQKNDFGWPQQPPTERVSDISEKLEFWWSTPQKGTGIGHLGARDDQIIRICKFFDEMRLLRSLRPLRLLRPQRPLRLQRFLDLKNHYWGLLSHPGIWIQLYFYVLKKSYFGVGSWNIILNFSTFSVRGCWGQGMQFFWKLVDETQKCNPPEATRHHNPRKIFILLPLKAI